MRRTWVLVAIAIILAIAAGAAVGASLADDDDGDDARSSSTSAESTTTTGADRGTSTTSPTLRGLTVLVAPVGVMGWWDGSAWVQARGMTVPVTGGETYAIVRGDEPLTTAVGGGVEPTCQIVEDLPSIDLAPPFRAQGSPLELEPIAVQGTTDPRIRPVEQLDVGSRAYREIAAAELRAVGIDAEPSIVQALRTDLDGDGRDEVLLVVERLSDPDGLYAQEGDHAFVFLREVTKAGEVRTAVLHRSENLDLEPNETPFVEIARISSIADLNGDGAMEIVLSTHYYEGNGTQVLEHRPGAGAERVVAAGCGV